MSLFDALDSEKIIQKHYLIGGFDLTSPPVQNMATMARIEPPVMSAVYFVFVNHENKVQLLKRLDIVPTEKRKLETDKRQNSWQKARICSTLWQKRTLPSDNSKSYKMQVSLLQQTPSPNNNLMVMMLPYFNNS